MPSASRLGARGMTTALLVFAVFVLTLGAPLIEHAVRVVMARREPPPATLSRTEVEAWARTR